MGVLEGLQPEKVFKYFEQICSIPHGSGNVEAISNYLCDFAKQRGLTFIQDEYYNVIIKKPASDNAHSKIPVILQGHMDMVAVKTQDKVKDMDKDGLDLIIENGYIGADGTSLGADDGIAVAYALAILDSDEYVHPPIEAIFTVDEEVGMTGAQGINTDCIDGRMMLNIDSEEEGTFLAGCAGGATFKIQFPVHMCKSEGIETDIRIHGLTSGHSGTDIIHQRANANNIAGRILLGARNKGIRIISINGGEKDNSIAPYADIRLIIDKDMYEETADCINKTAQALKREYLVTDPEMQIEINKGRETVCDAYDNDTTQSIINALEFIPDGVIRMSNDIEGLVETSLNLGVISSDDTACTATYLIRSSVDSQKEYIIQKVTDIAQLIGGKCSISGVYPAWEFQRESMLRDIMCDSYKELYGSNPKVETMHAGVECGIMAAKIKGLDCVSFGPDIKDIHTVKERLDIQSTMRTWELIIDILKKLADR